MYCGGVAERTTAVFNVSVALIEAVTLTSFSGNTMMSEQPSCPSAGLSTHLLVVCPQHVQLSGAHQGVWTNRRQLLTGLLWSPAV